MNQELLPKHVTIKTVEKMNSDYSIEEYTVINGKVINMQQSADVIANQCFQVIGCTELKGKFDLNSKEFNGMYLPEFLEYVLKTYGKAPYIVDHLPNETKIAKSMLID